MGNHSSSTAGQSRATASHGSSQLDPAEMKIWLERCQNHIDEEGLMFLYAKFQSAVNMCPSSGDDKRPCGITRLGFEQYMQSTGAFKGPLLPPPPCTSGHAARETPNDNKDAGLRSASSTRASSHRGRNRSSSSQRDGEPEDTTPTQHRRRRAKSGGGGSSRQRHHSSSSSHRHRHGTRSSSSSMLSGIRIPDVTPADPLQQSEEVAAAASSLSLPSYEEGTPAYAHLFRAFDADRDGIISFADFVTYHLAMGYNSDERLSAILFHAYDADEDGWLTFSDILEVITASTYCVGDVDLGSPAVQKVCQQEAQRLMAFLDVYRTGLVGEDILHCIGQRHPEVLEKMKYLL